ncbi:MAG: hypothetical protein AUI36_11950 [Cyanobacteria bacterium 13_1_40CM_2_61_4]|nr:MAG: hypothetical protein AUI36_11950 [Cyanobacteria bacterium 13_1_40CM_2_61_4]
MYRKVVEQRKEKPTEYDALAATFHANREKARRPFTKVENKPTKAATEFLKKPIDELIDTFIKIYGSGHYDTEMWKLAAHLHEEIGEAAVQIMNIAELTWHRTHGLGFSNVLSKAVARKRRERVDLNPKLLKKLEMQKTDDALFDFLRDGAVSKLKEELADVFTWLTAMLHKIREDRRSEAEPHFWKLLNENFATRGKTPGPWCRACGAFECEHDCLVTTV